MKLIILLCLFSSYSYAYDVLIPKRLDSKVVNQYFDTVLSKIYSNIDIDAKPVFITEEQINKRIKENNYDALFSKISDKNIIEHSITISPPLIEKYQVYRWKLKASKVVKKRFTVGAITGVIAHSKAIIKNRSMFSNVHYFSNYKDMIKAIYEQKIDLVLLSNEEYFNVFSQSLKSELEKLPGPLITIQLNHFINKKHKNIQKQLTKEFHKWDKLKKLSFDDFVSELKSPN